MAATRFSSNSQAGTENDPPCKCKKPFMETGFGGVIIWKINNKLGSASLPPPALPSDLKEFYGKVFR